MRGCSMLPRWLWLPFVLLYPMGVMAQAKDLTADLTAVIASTQALIQQQLDADKSFCKFVGSWADFARGLRDKGKPLAEALALARQLPEQYAGWSPWFEDMTNEIFIGNLRSLPGEQVKALKEIRCLNMILQRQGQPLSSQPSTATAPRSGTMPSSGPLWVLWVQSYPAAMPLGAWSTKNECETNAISRTPQSSGVAFTCLPENVNPCGQRQ